MVKRNLLDLNGLILEVAFRIIDRIDRAGSFGDVLEDLEEFRQGKGGREALILYYELLISIWMVAQILPAGIAAGVAILLGQEDKTWQGSIATLLGGVLIFFPAASAVIAAIKLLLARRVIPERGFENVVPTRWQSAALPKARDNGWALILALLGSFIGWLFIR